MNARKRILGLAGLALLLSFIGTAIAATALPSPAHKPGPSVAGGEKKKSDAASLNVSLKALPRHKPDIMTVRLVAIEPASGGDIAVSGRATEEEAGKKETSLFSRMMNHLSPGYRLTDQAAARYARIFAFQKSGNFEKADAEIEQLTDKRLMGHVLFQRYMSPGYTATYEELAAWMQHYADHPGAQRIFDLGKKKSPKGVSPLASPRTSHGVYSQYDFDVGQLAAPYIAEKRHTQRQRDLIHAVNQLVDAGPTSALRKLESEDARGLLDGPEYDSLQADIAESYFYKGKTEEALKLASASARRSGKDVPLAGWVAGLSAWRLGQYADAATYFESAANSGRTSAWMSAAAAHWTARSYLRSRQPQKVGYWLRRAADYPRTFYGIISIKILGMDQASFNWSVPELTDRHVKALVSSSAGRRALALVDADRPDLAAQELSQINPGGNYLLQEAMISLATEKGMPALALRMGSSFHNESGDLYDAALFPDAPWMPPKGFLVDKALVHAFIRQESRFDAVASNRSSGAQGLMQLMPSTARHVAQSSRQRIDEDRLHDPVLNIDLGQKYLKELLGNSVVGNNLFKLAVAYNAGPGKLARWEQNAHYEDDPLLFIESIPVSETRIFVERVLANFWIYRLKYDQDTASLDRVAEGDWPVYAAQDNSRHLSLADASMFFSR